MTNQSSQVHKDVDGNSQDEDGAPQIDGKDIHTKIDPAIANCHACLGNGQMPLVGGTCKVCNGSGMASKYPENFNKDDVNSNEDYDGGFYAKSHATRDNNSNPDNTLYESIS